MITPLPETTMTRLFDWRLEERQASGLFIVSPSGALLCRVDVGERILFFYDKRAKTEVGIRLDDLTFNLKSL